MEKETMISKILFSRSRQLPGHLEMFSSDLTLWADLWAHAYKKRSTH